MADSGTVGARSAEQCSGVRVMIILADGCRVCLALDSIEGVYGLAWAIRPGPAAELPDGRRVPLVDWRQVTGVDGEPRTEPRSVLLVVRTGSGLVGLGADACLGMREISLVARPPIPTRLRDLNAEPLCFLFFLEQRPHLLLDPRALAMRCERQ